MNSIKLFLFILISLVFSKFIQCQNIIPAIQDDVVMDGLLNDKAWMGIKSHTNFHNYLPSDIGLADNQTEVKIFHDGEYLYVGAIYHDSTPTIQVGSYKRDDVISSIVYSESFVMILDAQGQDQLGYYFGVNAGGAQVDGLVERVNDGYDISTSWNTVWYVSTSSEGNDKIYEMKIPLKNLNYDIKNPTFKLQFYQRDNKIPGWTIFQDVDRNYRLFDLRFTVPFDLEQAPEVNLSKLAMTPSITTNFTNDKESADSEVSIKPSLDIQYNLTSTLRLDLTANPDFSQIDVDQQVTNLTRFSLFFPERRNFFLENADLFANLGNDEVIPFYSRRIGAERDIVFGAKLSGNIGNNTRIGLLNVHTASDDEEMALNFGSVVWEQKINSMFSATSYLVSKQEVKGLEVGDDYNRVTGVNLNFKSNNNRWTGVAQGGFSFNDGIYTNRGYYNMKMFYNSRKSSYSAGVKRLESNFIAETGFTPRLYSFDPASETTKREGYSQYSLRALHTSFPKQELVNQFRYLNLSGNVFFDDEGQRLQTSLFYNTALFFKNLSATYLNVYFEDINLKYAFDPLGNGSLISPDRYKFTRVRLGYNSTTAQSLIWRTWLQAGKYYSGNIFSGSVSATYLLMPRASIKLGYEMNKIDLHELGSRDIHLLKFTTEVFFGPQLNWTTYIQYNTQSQSINTTSRVQWEYQPLSYIYFVLSNNLDEQFHHKNYGVALKLNYRLDI